MWIYSGYTFCCLTQGLTSHPRLALSLCSGLSQVPGLQVCAVTPSLIGSVLRKLSEAEAELQVTGVCQFCSVATYTAVFLSLSLFLFFETASHSIAPTGLELTENCLPLPLSAGSNGVYHQACHVTMCHPCSRGGSSHPF